MKKSILTATTVVLAIAGLLGAYLVLRSSPPNDGVPQKPKTVVLGVLPYLDHTYAYVGVEKGWFREAGLEVQIREVDVEQIIPFLQNHTVQVCSTPPGILMAAWDSAPGLRSFVFGNLFTGYAIIAQPGGKCLTYRQLRSDGFSKEEAAKQTMEQLRGKRFAYPPEDAIRPFIDLSLQLAGMTLADVQTKVTDDPLTVNAMRSKDVDFQTGGAPSRIRLEGEGFIPIFTSRDLLDFAEPSENSPELAGILQNGWATTKGFYDDNPDVIKALAAVSYRIMQALANDEADARRIHLESLRHLTGDPPYSPVQIASFYGQLNDFRPFDKQLDWFTNTKSREYYKHVNGAILKSWTSRPGYYRHPPPSVEDVIFADDTYFGMCKARDSFAQRRRNIETNKSVLMSDRQKENFKHAIDLYDRYEFDRADSVLREITSALGIEGR